MFKRFGVLGLALSVSLALTTAARAEEIKFAMSPRYANTVCAEMMDPLLKYLSEKTGNTFVQVFPSSYDDHVAKCRAGEIDLSYSNPLDFIKVAPKGTERASGFMPLVCAVLPDPEGAEYWGIIITRSDSGINSVQDLKGKKGMYVAPSALGGYLAQVASLKEEGIDVKRELSMVESPGQKQDAVVMAVYNKEVDYGFVRNEALEIAGSRVDMGQIKVVFSTQKIPQWIIAASPKIGVDLANRLKEILSNMTKENTLETGILKAAKVKKWKPIADEDLNPVRELATNTGTPW